MQPDAWRGILGLDDKLDAPGVMHVRLGRPLSSRKRKSLWDLQTLATALRAGEMPADAH